MAAELFSGMEEMATHELRPRPKLSLDSRDKTFEVVLPGSTRLSLVGAHCFGKDVVYVRVAMPQCWVLCSGYYAPWLWPRMRKTRD
jgi:hypothetical protein